MTDEEIICAWMEPKPATVEDADDFSPEGWWTCIFTSRGDYFVVEEWAPRRLTQDLIWEVQDRLDDEQWEEYHRALVGEMPFRVSLFYVKDLMHAKADKKIKALAAVLRPLVEAPK